MENIKIIEEYDDSEEAIYRIENTNKENWVCQIDGKDIYLDVLAKFDYIPNWEEAIEKDGRTYLHTMNISVMPKWDQIDKELIQDIAVKEAINTDGRGHFIASYDDCEEEMDGFFIYRVS